MTLKCDANFGEELTCPFKTDTGNLTYFDEALKSLKNFHVNGLFLRKLYIVSAKTVQRSYLS